MKKRFTCLLLALVLATFAFPFDVLAVVVDVSSTEALSAEDTQNDSDTVESASSFDTESDTYSSDNVSDAEFKESTVFTSSDSVESVEEMETKEASEAMETSATEELAEVGADAEIAFTQASNNTWGTAKEIIAGTEYTDKISGKNEMDYYTFTLESASRTRVSLAYTKLNSKDAMFMVNYYDANRKQICSFEAKCNAASYNCPFVGLPEGKYYVRISSPYVNSTGTSSSYTLKLNVASSKVWETELNNTTATADDIVVDRAYYGSLYSSEDVDYYRLTLVTKAKVNISVNHSVISKSDVYWVAELLNTSGSKLVSLNVTGNKEKSESAYASLSAGTYYVRVKASAYYSAYYSFTVNAEMNLSTPQITGFDSVDKGVKITWGKIIGAAKYRVYYYGKNGWTSMGDTTSTSFIDTDVGSGKTYTYSVRCVNLPGTSFTSEMNTTGWKYTYNMATPQITDMTSTANGVKITWGKVKNASRYRVYYKNSKGNWVKMTETTSLSYLDSDVSFGKNYTYTVRCVNADGRFTSDCNSTGWKHLHYLATPQITKMTNSTKGVTITWGKVTGAVKYRVYYKNKNGNWVKMGESTTTSFLDSDVSYGSTYTYTVRCISADDKTFTSDCNSTGWKHTYYLDTPQITGLTSIAKGVKIVWKSVGAAKYRVYYYGSKGWTKMGEVTGTSFIDEDVRVGTTYRYTVRCVNADGSKFTSDCNSDGWKYTYNPQLSAPAISGFETVSNGVKITWGAVTNANNYRVYYKNKNGNWVKMGDTTGLSFVDTDVKSGTTYTYSVRCLAAKEGDFASGYSAAKSHTYISIPSITSIASESGGIRIKWSAMTGAAKYRLYRKTTGSYEKIAETSAVTYFDKNVTKGVTYTYTVRCISSAGYFTSYYNTTGWKCTYGTTDWSTLYKNYINNKSYTSYIPAAFKSQTPYFFIYDIDFDGTPELFMNTGYAAVSNNHEVFSVSNGRVVHLFSKPLGGSFNGYAPNSNYKGFFSMMAHTGVVTYEYHYMNNGAWYTETVLRLGDYFATDTYTEVFRTSNTALYNTFMSITKPSTAPKGLRDFIYPGVQFNYDEIKSMGWNCFIAKYGY